MASHFQSAMRRYQENIISAKQAIREAAHIRQSFDIVPQLQANFAFSKPYVADRSGTKGGLGGANFYIDLALFDSPTRGWLVLGETVNWSYDRLRIKASFAPILDIRPVKEGGPLGIRDGLEVAKHLTQDPKVLDALRAAQKPR